MKLFISALAVLSLVTTTTFAGDGKLYPGAMGIRWNSSDPFPALNSSMIQNPSSTQWLRLDLPVVHAVMGNSIKKGWVKAVDRSYNKNVRCKLVSVYRNGSSFWGWSTGFKYTGGSGSGPQTLNFGNVGANSSCHYYFSCHIPPTYSGNKSGIVSYYVEEK